MSELPGILLWALDGLRRLTERGHFVIPKSVRNTVREAVQLGSPVQQFVQECCVIDREGTVAKDELYLEWRNWCEQNGERSRSKSGFGKALKSALGHQLETVRLTGADGQRPWGWRGLMIASGHNEF